MLLIFAVGSIKLRITFPVREDYLGIWIFSYASSSTLHSCQSVSQWAEFRTSVASSLRACCPTIDSCQLTNIMFRGSSAPVPPFTFTTFVLQLILDCRGSSAPVPPGSLGWCSTKRDINGIHVNGPSGSPWVTLLLSFQNEICSSMSADSMETLGLLLYDKDNIFFPNQNQRGRPLLSPL